MSKFNDGDIYFSVEENVINISCWDDTADDDTKNFGYLEDAISYALKGYDSVIVIDYREPDSPYTISKCSDVEE